MLRTGDDINAKIESEIAQTDLALVFLSEHYCRSESCAKELQTIIDQGVRTFLIELDETWAEDVEPQMRPMKAHFESDLTARFWETKDNQVHKFGFPLPSVDRSPFKQNYLEAQQRLVRDIKDVTRELVQARGEDHAEVPEDLEHVNVLLAMPTGDTKVEVDRLERAYQERGYSVLRLDHLSDGISADHISALLEKCDLYVQIFGSVPGKRLGNGMDGPLVIAQYELATTANASIAARSIEDLDIEEVDEAYAEFLNSAVYHDSLFEEFEQYTARIVDEKVRERESNQRRQERQSTEETYFAPLVSIDAAETDAELSRRIHEALKDHVDVVQLDYHPNRTDLQDAVSDNDAIVLVYGPNEDGWKRANKHFQFFRRFRRQVSNAENQKLEIAIGDASPATAPGRPSGPGVHLIKVEDKVDSASLQAFLASLGVPGAAERPL
jgi:hypothetical protein